MTGPEADAASGMNKYETTTASGLLGFPALSRASGEEGWPSHFDSVRLAQGLEATLFPLPAVSPQTFVALPVAWG